MRKRLALVTSSYPIAGDGSEAAGSFVSDLVSRLAKSCDILVIAPGGSAAVEHPMVGVTVYRFQAPARPMSTLKPWHPVDAWLIVRALFSISALLRNITKRNGGVCHIFALWAFPAGYLARSAARRAQVGYSVWTLGSDIWSLARVPVLKQVIARVVRDARHCYSDGFDLAEQTALLGSRHVEFLPTSRELCSEESVFRSEPPFRLLFIGRWHANKGADLLMEALHLLNDGDWSAIESIQIYGGGPLSPLVKAEGEVLRALGRPVSVYGFIEKKKAARALANADYVLIPSRIESIPVIFSDAMQVGRPVISNPAGDLSVLVKQYDVGYLADSCTALGFARAISAAMHGMPPSRENIRMAAAKFSLSAVVNRLRDDLGLA